MYGQHDLLIRSVRLGDAGIYECVKTWSDQPSAHLTVIYGMQHKHKLNLLYPVLEHVVKTTTFLCEYIGSICKNELIFNGFVENC